MDQTRMNKFFQLFLVLVGNCTYACAVKFYSGFSVIHPGLAGIYRCFFHGLLCRNFKNSNEPLRQVAIFTIFSDLAGYFSEYYKKVLNKAYFGLILPKF